MANLQIKNIPEDMHEKLRVRAKARGVTLREYVLELLRHDLRRPSVDEWLKHRASLPPINFGRPIDELIREDREERMAHLESLGSMPIPPGQS